jgi:hypothetical protein
MSIIGTLILFLTFCLGILRRQFTISNLVNSNNLHFFLLGAGFMLLETKAVTELSLLFGSTWIVNSVVITAFLVMAIVANTLMMFRRLPKRISYLALLVLLCIEVFLPYSLFNYLPGVMRTSVAATFASLPILFSGLIFSSSFSRVQYPAQALGVNLLGAVIGGVLENMVMIGGTPILGALAIILYGLSALALRPGLALLLCSFRRVAPPLRVSV